VAGFLREFQGLTASFSVDGTSQGRPFLTRVDPLSGNVAKISPERARRTIGISVEMDMRPATHCSFCDYTTATPQPRIQHAGGAVSVPNLYPWEKYDWITIYPPFSQHKVLLSDLYFEDMEMMMESSYDLAERCAYDKDVIAFMDFTNWGAFAGASQQHPHSQRKSITSLPDPAQGREWQRCLENLETLGRHPFDILLQEEREDGRRLIFDNDVVVLAAFAPTCSDELLVFPREDLSHILQSTPAQRNHLMRQVLGIFPALFLYRGITDLNIAMHMAPFAAMEPARKYFRWHMHVYPRRSRLPADRAGAEIGFQTSVIDTLPETTAEALRHWYEAGPREEMVARCADGTPSPLLVRELRRISNGNGH
jgi:galactose-1-phosphate uridylyltransferase